MKKTVGKYVFLKILKTLKWYIIYQYWFMHSLNVFNSTKIFKFLGRFRIGARMHIKPWAHSWLNLALSTRHFLVVLFTFCNGVFAVTKAKSELVSTFALATSIFWFMRQKCFRNKCRDFVAEVEHKFTSLYWIKSNVTQQWEKNDLFFEEHYCSL